METCTMTFECCGKPRETVYCSDCGRLLKVNPVLGIKPLVGDVDLRIGRVKENMEAADREQNPTRFKRNKKAMDELQEARLSLDILVKHWQENPAY